MYGILPTTAENFGALMSGAGLALAAYVVVPILGGIIGFTCPISPLVSPSLATTIQKSHLVLKKQQLKVISGKIMEKVIEVKNLVKVYGKRSAAFTALKHLDLDIYKGESVAIVGKSGSGKSTLMHLLALLDKPTSGTIKINGVDSTKLRARKLNQLRNRSFGFVFQQFFMNPNDTVLENVMLPLKIAGTKRKSVKSSPQKRWTQLVSVND